MPLTQFVIDGVGWRAAWVVLALVGAGLIAPLSILFVRRQPEDLGLLPDGATALEHGATAQADEHSWTRAQALRALVFWRLVVAFGLLSFGIGMVALHRIPSFMDRGLDPTMVAYATALDAGAAGLAGFTAGLVTRRVPVQLLAALGCLILALASVLTIMAGDHVAMFASMIIFGLGIGVWILLQGYLWAAYFGRAHLGAIRGAIMPLTLAFGGAGAPLAVYVQDTTGSYHLAWIAAIGLMLISALTLALTPTPGRAA